MTLIRGVIALLFLAAAGCAKMAPESAKDAATAEETAAAPEPTATDDTRSRALAAGTPDPTPLAPTTSIADGRRDSIDDPSAATEAQPPQPPAATADLPPAAPERPVVAPAAHTAREPGRASALIAPPVASPPSVETLDFTALVARLRKTKAINLRTKFAVKNESDDLLDRFRAYHARHGTATLAELRRSYDSLFLKLYSLLEDADPPLARDIDRSRAAIWAVLADPMKFGASAPIAPTPSSASPRA